jgi:hypothetical protein
MRILLDTNVWRYLIDSGRYDQLYRLANQTRIEISVAPGVIIETLRIQNDTNLRNNLIEAQTRPCWHRLMPDAYLECEQFKEQLLLHLPRYFKAKKDLDRLRQLRFNWLRKKGGWWDYVRANPGRASERYFAQDNTKLEDVRKTSRESRKKVAESGDNRLGNKAIGDVEGSWGNSKLGVQIKLDGWRVFGEATWKHELAKPTVWREWTECEVNIDYLLGYGTGDFRYFWMHTAEEQLLSRTWVRYAAYLIQSERKVTSGNPTDAQLATHFVDVDFVLSGDKNFISMANKIQDEAPFRSAHGLLLEGGQHGVEQLFTAMTDGYFVSKSSKQRQ